MKRLHDDRPPEMPETEPPATGPQWLAPAGIIASGLAIIAGALCFSLGVVAALGAVGLVKQTVGLAVVTIALLQVGTVFFTLLFAANRGPLSSTLGLRAPRMTPRGLALLSGLVIVLVSASVFVSLFIFREQFIRDAAAFREMLRSDWAVLAVIVVTIGAPISEELAFRGFIFGGLVRTGASVLVAFLVSNILWTLMHAGYSIVGLVEVFVAGIVLTAAYQMSGSLVLPIAIHAAYNLIALGLMRYVGLV